MGTPSQNSHIIINGQPLHIFLLSMATMQVQPRPKGWLILWYSLAFIFHWNHLSVKPPFILISLQLSLAILIGHFVLITFKTILFPFRYFAICLSQFSCIVPFFVSWVCYCFQNMVTHFPLTHLLIILTQLIVWPHPTYYFFSFLQRSLPTPLFVLTKLPFPSPNSPSLSFPLLASHPLNFSRKCDIGPSRKTMTMSIGTLEVQDGELMWLSNLVRELGRSKERKGVEGWWIWRWGNGKFQIKWRGLDSWCGEGVLSVGWAGEERRVNGG